MYLNILIFSTSGLISLMLILFHKSGSASGKHQGISSEKIRSLVVRCLNANVGAKEWRMKEYMKELNLTRRREMIGLVCGMSSLVIDALNVKASGLQPEDKPKLCDDACEKELENVW